jgi:hypothetical protein
MIVIVIPAEKTDIIKNQVNESNKITISICDTEEIQKYDVYITEKQVKKLDDLFNDISSDLKNSNSFNDEKKIYLKALNSFQELNLIKDDITHRIISKILLKKIFYHNILKDIFINSNLGVSQERENILCTIVGKSNCTHFFRMFRWPIWYNWPVGFNNIIGFGTYLFPNETNPNPVWFPSYGWLNSNGLYGYVTWSNWFFGNMSYNFYAGYTYYTVGGVTGFTGFKFEQENRVQYYYGAATRVKLDAKIPPTPTV